MKTAKQDFKNLDRVAEIEKLLVEYSEAYYNEDPLVEDPEYDLLADELRSLCPTSKVLKQIGAKASNTVWPEYKFDKKNDIAMGSQLKVNTPEEFLKWAKSTGAKSFCWSEKLDGSSLAMKYEACKLVQGVSRGDGITGSDITPNVKKVRGLPKSLGATGLDWIKSKIWIRAEVIMKKDTFEQGYRGKINPESGRPYKNPRNTAAGAVRRLSGEGCSDLGAVAYDVEGIEFKTQSDKFMWLGLEGAGFFVPAWGVGTAEEIVEVYKRYVTSEREECPFEIDGLVVAVDDLELQKSLGIVDNRPKGQRAFKFPSEGVETTIEAITWQVGRTGRCTPVAEITPTDIGGVTISRVIMNNTGLSIARGLGIGARVILRRAGDVIPEITHAIKQGKPIEPPTKCPCCSEPTSRDGAYVVCTNTACPDQKLGYLLNYLRALDVKGFGEGILTTLIAAGYLEDLPDFYKLVPDFFESQVVGTKLLTEFENKAREVALPIFIDALGIHGVGENLATLVMAEFPTLRAMQEARVEQLEAIEGIGPGRARFFVDGLAQRSSTINALLKHVNLAEVRVAVAATGDTLKGKVFCFTGFRDKDLECRIAELSGVYAPSFRKDVTHLIAKDAEGSSGKLDKARAKGVIVISRMELEAML